jgi:hypothetical protein
LHADGADDDHGDQRHHTEDAKAPAMTDSPAAGRNRGIAGKRSRLDSAGSSDETAQPVPVGAIVPVLSTRNRSRRLQSGAQPKVTSRHIFNSCPDDVGPADPRSSVSELSRCVEPAIGSDAFPYLPHEGGQGSSSDRLGPTDVTVMCGQWPPGSALTERPPVPKALTFGQNSVRIRT